MDSAIAVVGLVGGMLTIVGTLVGAIRPVVKLFYGVRDLQSSIANQQHSIERLDRRLSRLETRRK